MTTRTTFHPPAEVPYVKMSDACKALPNRAEAKMMRSGLLFIKNMIEYHHEDCFLRSSLLRRTRL